MLSRSLSDCKSLLLNVMIQVSQFVSNSQLCHQVTKLLSISIAVSVVIVVIVVTVVTIVTEVANSINCPQSKSKPKLLSLCVCV